MNELLPCPFCGGHDIRVADVCSVTFACGCMDCGASAWVASSEAEAIEAWNTRADDYRQAAEYWQRMYEEKFAERTCRIVTDGQGWWECDECGCTIDWDSCDPNDPPSYEYCPHCGRKVVN